VGAVASLKDTAAQADVKAKTLANRTKTTRELEAWGYPTIPSQTDRRRLGHRLTPMNTATD
jgi:hypothetical protein